MLSHSTLGLSRRPLRGLFFVAATVVATTALAAPPVVFQVNLGAASQTPVSGRLLVFAKALGAGARTPVPRVDMDQIDAHAVAIAAQEIGRLEPGGAIDLDADVTAFPSAFSKLRPGRYAVQAASFEWVFSPRGPGGSPVPMFDHATGAVDPAVIAYWKEHYDVAEQIRRRWPEVRRDLDGKIHLTVGSADTFYLDGSARRLEATLKTLRARADFRYIEGRGHFDLYIMGDDRWSLYKIIAREMYAIARPGSKRLESRR